MVCYLCLQFVAGTDAGAAAVITGTGTDTVPAVLLLVATATPLPVAVIIAGRLVPSKAPDSCDGPPALGVCVFPCLSVILQVPGKRSYNQYPWEHLISPPWSI